MKLFQISVAASILVLSSHVNAGLVVGGGFENPVVAGPNYQLYVTPSGWSGSGDMVRQGYAGAVDSGDGDQWFDLNPGTGSGSGISQVIALDAGTTYMFSFLYNGGGGGSTNQISFSLDSGENVLFTDAVSTAGMDVYYGGTDWNLYSTIFTPQSTESYTLSFVPNGSWSGGFIDRVDLTATSIPVPAAAWFLGSALVSLVSAGCKTRRKNK